MPHHWGVVFVFSLQSPFKLGSLLASHLLSKEQSFLGEGGL